MSGSTRRQHDADGDDALRELMSSILSGRYTEETYLWDVSAVCRARPESAPRLLALMDRYKRLGRMPAEQYAKVRARVEQALAPQGARVEVLVEGDELDDDQEENSLTSELVSTPRPPAGSRAAPVRAPSVTPSVVKEPPVPPPAAFSQPPAAHIQAAAPTQLISAAVAQARVAPPPASGDLPHDGMGHTSVGSFAETRILGNPTRLIPPAPELSELPDRPASAGVASTSSPAPTSTLTSIGVGTVLHDRYELKHLLGRGGIATVYKAVDRYRVNLGLEDCHVAVKIVQPHPSRPGSVAALGREFHNAQLLSHPNVINVFNIDHAGDASFYTMELLDGERLSQVVKRVGTLARRHALAVIRDIGAAVAHAHSRGVVHADLKPHNVMLTQTGQVRVLDFGSGIIRAREPWISEMSPGDSYRQATPAYASCEQLEGWSADPRDDIYALACLSYLLLTGRHPFNMRPSLEARAQRLQPRRPPGLSGESWRALRRGLSWTREQRTMSVEDWIRDLGVDKAAESLPPLSLLQTGRPGGVWSQRAAAAALAVVGLGLIAFTVEDWQPALHDRLHVAWHGLSALADAAGDSASQEPAVSLPPIPAPSPVVTHRFFTPSLPAYARGAGNGAASTESATTAAAVEAIPAASVSAAHAARAAREQSGGDETPEGRVTISTTSAEIGSSGDAAVAGDAAAPAELPQLEFSATSYVVPSTEPAARIVIRRSGSTDGDVNFVWWTEEASAKADVDYASLGRRVERIPSGTDRITVYVPIISTPQRSDSTQFYVALSQPGGGREAAPGARSLVTIDHGG